MASTGVSRQEPAAGTWILTASILASSMVFIDSTAVGIALPVMQTDLHATIADAQWFVEAYALFLSALILVGGAAGDQFGRRRIFLYGLAGFTGASVLCGLSRTAGELVAARAIQGAASALLTPGSLAILGASFDERQRGKAIGLWSSFTAVAATAGPLLGGYLVGHASWRWVFFINVPIAIATAAISLRWIRESRDEALSRTVDWPGAFTATTSLGAIIYALIAAGTGWTAADIAWLAGGVAMLVTFIVVEGRVTSPMMPLELFGDRTFDAINMQTLLLYAALGAATFFLPFDLIQVQRYSPQAAGASLLPFVVLVSSLSPFMGGVVARFGAKLPLFAGSCIAALGMAGLAMPGIGGTYWSTFFPPIAALGLGMAFVVSPLTSTVMSCVPQERFGIASGVNNAVARTGSLLAVAGLTLALVATFNRSLDERLAHAAAPAAAVAQLKSERDQLAAAPIPAAAAPARAALADALDRAYVDGFRVTMLLSAGLALAAALCALSIDARLARPSS